MNLVLIEIDEILDQHQHASAESIVHLTDERAQHIISVIKPNIGDELRIGIIGGALGTAIVKGFVSDQPSSTSKPTNQVTLAINSIERAPPEKLPLSIIVALPRPKSVIRIIRHCTECGVRSLHFINSYRVEKSYWSSPRLDASNIATQINLGLAQSIDTVPMHVDLHQRFKPFVEDELPLLIKNGRAQLLHPYAETAFDANASAVMHEDIHQWLIIGPEGGFIPYEIEKLVEAGAVATNIGRRIYRTETIIPMLLGHFTMKNGVART